MASDGLVSIAHSSPESACSVYGDTLCKQVNAAGVVDTVNGVAFHHGGDPLCTLSNSMGTWHEDCVELVNE